MLDLVLVCTECFFANTVNNSQYGIEFFIALNVLHTEILAAKEHSRQWF